MSSDGAGDPARAFLLILDGVAVAGRLWSGHSRIMGCFGTPAGGTPLGGANAPILLP